MNFPDFYVFFHLCSVTVWMAPPKKGTLPKPLPEGFILRDTEKKKWRLGKIIGQGGFGLIYLGTHLFVAWQYNCLAVSDTAFIGCFQKPSKFVSFFNRMKFTLIYYYLILIFHPIITVLCLSLCHSLQGCGQTCSSRYCLCHKNGILTPFCLSSFAQDIVLG